MFEFKIVGGIVFFCCEEQARFPEQSCEYAGSWGQVYSLSVLLQKQRWVNARMSILFRDPRESNTDEEDGSVYPRLVELTFPFNQDAEECDLLRDLWDALPKEDRCCASL